MKVRINSIAYQSKATGALQKHNPENTYFSFLVSVVDPSNATPVDLRFDRVAADGVKIGNFKETFTIDFSAQENQKVIDKLNLAKASGQILVYEFTCSGTSKGAPFLKENGETTQTIALWQDRFADRSISVAPAPAIKGL